MTNQLTLVEEDNRRVDALEASLLDRELQPAPMNLTHLFTSGLYTRQIRLQADSIWTTKIHRTQHPFVILEGSVSVWTPGCDDVVTLEGPYIGITEPNTRRVILVHTDTTWITFHTLAHEGETLEEIEKRIIEPHTIEVDGQQVDGHRLYLQKLTQAAEQSLPSVEAEPLLLPLEDYMGAP